MPSSLESDVFRWLQSRGLWTQTRDSNPNVVVGPGDDAAVMARPAGDVVVSTDMLSDDVDFLLAAAKPELVGRKALGVNLSDLAAMAATPIGFTASVAVDKNWSKPAYGNLSCLNYLKRLCEGMLTLADEFNCPLVGGDTNCFNGPLTISITVFGVIPRNSQGRKKYIPWTRSAAQPGDAILLTGAVGGSIHGRQFTFTPRVNEALYLRQNYDVHAAMDISDGLSLDLFRMTTASNVGAALDLGTIPIHRDVKKSEKLGVRSEELTQSDPRNSQLALQHALSDGEDFELILTVAPKTTERILNDETLRSLGAKIARIGTVVNQPGLWTTDEKEISPSGWLH